MAIVLATILATAFHTGHAASMPSSWSPPRQRWLLPVIQSLKPDDQNALDVTAQIAIADAVCIVLLPLVINPVRAVPAAIGARIIATCTGAFAALRAVDRRGMRRRCTTIRPASIALGC